MKTEQQIKALAELDGWKEVEDIEIPTKSFNGSKANLVHGWSHPTKGIGYGDYNPPNYLTSYDAIIPLIQKQQSPVKADVWVWLQNNAPGIYAETPAQLCEALLRATGKWIE